jgi:hypothetical protein
MANMGNAMWRLLIGICIVLLEFGSRLRSPVFLTPETRFLADNLGTAFRSGLIGGFGEMHHWGDSGGRFFFRQLAFQQYCRGRAVHLIVLFSPAFLPAVSNGIRRARLARVRDFGQLLKS